MKFIPLTRGYQAIVDDADYERVMAAGPWFAQLDKHTVYARRSIRLAANRWTNQSLHRFLLGLSNPKTPVDHANHNGLDNRRGNLRVCTPTQSAANTRKRRGLTSRFKGVRWNKAIGKWHAQICVDGKKKHLGFFDSEIDAAVAYYRVSLEIFGKFCTTKEKGNQR
jgi:hypothetical protein